ncbi:MAG: SBBP repeat-containing protein, partial [Promethearchaeota archaeon]
MKNRKIFLLIILVFILYLSLYSLKENATLSGEYHNNKRNEQENNENKNINPISSVYNPIKYEWSRKWNGDDDNDWCSAIAINSSNDIYMAGGTFIYNSPTSGRYAMCLVKYNNLGVEQWNHTWDGANGADDIKIDSNNNIYLIGNTDGMDICLVKFNSSGDYQWSAIWGGSGNDQCFSLALDSLDNIYIAGLTNSFGAGNEDLCLLKFNSTGDYQWNVTWGGSGNDRGHAIGLDDLNNIFVAGSTNSFGAGNNDLCLLKFNSTGDYQWNVTWGGSGNDRGNAIALDNLNNIFVAGSTNSYGAGNNDLCLVKFNNTGDYQWNVTWGGSGNDRGNAIALDNLNNIFVAGSTNSFGAGNSDLCLVKFNKIGCYQWNVTRGGKGNDRGYAIALDDLDNIYLAGSTCLLFADPDNDMYIVKYYILPWITINSPNPYQLFGNKSLNFDVSINEPHLNTTWYSLNYGLNYTFSGTSGTIDKIAWDACGNGTVSIKFYANDSVGNVVFNEIIVYKDTSFPNITINSPTPYQLFGNATVDFDLTINDPN